MEAFGVQKKWQMELPEERKKKKKIYNTYQHLLKIG